MRFVISLFALLILCTVSEAGPVRRLIEHRQQRKQQAAFAPACVCGNNCKCAPGTCPAGCPVTAPAVASAGYRRVCSNGVCRIVPAYR